MERTLKLTATRPVTIYKTENSVVINPHLLRLPGGALMLWLEDGHDSNFTPIFRMRSFDNGKTWQRDGQPVPRCIACHVFDDGEVFEIDAYGYWDPATPDTYYYYGAWSHPERANDAARTRPVKAELPGLGRKSLREMHRVRSYPNYLWWPLANQVVKNDNATQDDIFIGGIYMTDLAEHSGVLLGVGYTWEPSCRSICVESYDRGQSWSLRSVVAANDGPSAPDDFGFTETSIVTLKDGRLYAVMRTDMAHTGHVLHHVWSSDGGLTWTKPARLQIIDTETQPAQQLNWPRCIKLADGTLVLSYGRPGKHVLFDPSGTGTQWQGHLDLHQWELETQAFMGVPQDKWLHGDTGRCVRYWDSMDYLALAAIGPREVLVCYDVQTYYENWNASPFSGVRMVRITLG
jgi:hypothetical protein